MCEAFADRSAGFDEMMRVRCALGDIDHRDLTTAQAHALAFLDELVSPDPVWRNRGFGRILQVHRTRVSRNVLCQIIRDIFGNPFRPVAFNPSWRTFTAVGLARTMYESRDFTAMPILADALEEAGCDELSVLAHCRGDGSHVRGCWVVDLVLGKS
jgi:hypothetical protein